MIEKIKKKKQRNLTKCPRFH